MLDIESQHHHDYDPKRPPLSSALPPRMHPSTGTPVIIIAMGVSGAGKSTIGKAISETFNLPFIEGDELHPPENIAKMGRGEPLTDQDREPWLELLRKKAVQTALNDFHGNKPNFNHSQANSNHQNNKDNNNGRPYPNGHSNGRNGRIDRLRGVVVSCSSLKKYYREILRGSKLEEGRDIPTYFVYIKGHQKTLEERLAARQGHYMKLSMLESQLSTLECPDKEGEGAGSGVVVIKLEDSTEDQLRQAKEGLERAMYHGVMGV